MYLRREMQVHGLFLSSGVHGNPDKVTEKMIESVKIIRHKHNFKGYVHFKVLPGTSKHLIKQASELSNRMSINIESPNSTVMNELSSCKDFKVDILRRQSWITKLGKNQTTQMILNRLSTDKDILKMINWEYDAFKLRRVYFSGFKPIKGTELEKEKAEPMHRQNHLYNIDFLVRRYNYTFKEFNGIMNNGMLPNCDPKLAMAKANFESRVDVNEASYGELIRVPGIGPKTAETIMVNQGKIKKFEDLHNFGVRIENAKPFIEVNGKKQMTLMEF
jgi:predicted DNA-binding helix-hairpin-helix protein